MGEVYRARDVNLKRDVAVKILPSQLASDPERVARFQREAEVLASLNHSSIASIYGVAEAEGTQALVMEFVEGESPSGPMPFEDAWKIMMQVADGLEYAHERRVVHRDLKPSNLKVTPEGRVKILDFGLAKALSGTGPQSASAQGANSPTLTMGATQAGVILGTAAYMAPEQIKGKEADRRADIWAFGVVLYELLTGERPFKGKDSTEIMAHTVTSEPSLDKAPSKVRRLLTECLKKEPEERLRWVGDVARFLEQPSESPGLAAAEAPGARSSRLQKLLWPVVATVAIVAAAVLAFLHFREQPPVMEVMRFQIPAPEKTIFVSGPPTVSPDGRRLVFAAADQGGRIQLWVRSLDTLDVRPLTGTEGVGSYYFWSPDSRSIAFDQGSRLRKVDVSGGPPQTVTDIANGFRGGAWSTEGVIVFGTQGAGLVRVSEAGGAPAPLTMLDAARGETRHGVPFFLPDGRRFVYYRFSPSETRGVYLGSLDLKPEQQNSKRLLASDTIAVYAPSPDPDRPTASSKSNTGHLVFLRDGTLMAQPFDARKGELAGEAFPVAEGVGTSFQDGFFSVSTTGVLAYRTGSGTTGTNSQLLWFDRGGMNLGAAGDPGNYNVVALSPEGTRVAVTRTDASGNSQANTDVWVQDLARGTNTRLTYDPAQDGWPAWSPDGSRVAFSSSREGNYNLYDKDSSGAGSDELLLKSSEPKYVQDWSRDGRFLLYSQSGAGGNDLSVLPFDGGGSSGSGAPKAPMPYLKTEFNETGGRFSPDGQFVAYSSNQTGRDEIYVQPFPDPSKGRWEISRGGGVQPRWRRDGKELFYISADSKMMAVDITLTPTFKAGLPRALFAAPILGAGTINNGTRYDVTPDGKKFLINSTGGEAPGGPSAPITLVLNWRAALKK